MNLILETYLEGELGREWMTAKLRNFHQQIHIPLKAFLLRAMIIHPQYRWRFTSVKFYDCRVEKKRKFHLNLDFKFIIDHKVYSTSVGLKLALCKKSLMEMANMDWSYGRKIPVSRVSFTLQKILSSGRFIRRRKIKSACFFGNS